MNQNLTKQLVARQRKINALRKKITAANKFAGTSALADQTILELSRKLHEIIGVAS